MNVNKYFWSIVTMSVTLALLAPASPQGTARAQDLFHPKVSYEVGFDPRDVAADDLNNDDRPELVSVNELSDDISVLVNNGDGTFQTEVTYAVGDTPRSLAMGKLNSDNFVDVIVSNSESDTISILFGNGDGSLAPAVEFPVGDRPWGIVTARLNGDAHLDVAVVNADGKTFSVLLNDGDGMLSLAGSYTSGGFSIKPYWITTADFDTDGDMDIAVVKTYSNYVFSEGYVETFINDGTGAFTSTQVFDIGTSASTAVAGDLDGDDDVDLVVSGVVQSSYQVRVLINDGSGTFAEDPSYSSGASGRAAGGDFDGDGDFDVAVATAGVGSNGVSILLNDGSASYGYIGSESAGSYPMGVVTGDFDGDNDTDMAVAAWGEDSVAVILNNTASPASGVSVSLECTPGSGTLPFAVQFSAGLENRTEFNRVLAGRIDVTLAGGAVISNFKAGSVSLSPLGQFGVSWAQQLPARGALIGENSFALHGEDVTPPPFNQPPYPPAGDSAAVGCTVTGYAP